MVPGYGFVLNDTMDDFSVDGRANGTGYEPQKANLGGSIGNENSYVDRISQGREETVEFELSLYR